MTNNLKKKNIALLNRKILLSKNLIQHHAHITFQNFLYSEATFEHASVATTTTIIREVHLHEPIHRYCKLSILHAHCQNHFAFPPIQSVLNTDKQHF